MPDPMWAGGTGKRHGATQVCRPCARARHTGRALAALALLLGTCMAATMMPRKADPSQGAAFVATTGAQRGPKAMPVAALPATLLAAHGAQGPVVLAAASRSAALSYLLGAVALGAAAVRAAGGGLVRARPAAARAAKGCRVTMLAVGPLAPTPALPTLRVVPPPAPALAAAPAPAWAVPVPVPQWGPAAPAPASELPPFGLAALGATSARRHHQGQEADSDPAAGAAPGPAIGGTAPKLRRPAAARRVRGVRRSSGKAPRARSGATARRTARRESGARLAERPHTPEPYVPAYDPSRVRSQIQVGVRAQPRSAASRGREPATAAGETSGLTSNSLLGGHSFVGNGSDQLR